MRSVSKRNSLPNSRSMNAGLRRRFVVLNNEIAPTGHQRFFSNRDQQLRTLLAALPREFALHGLYQELKSVF